jgi:hypothetical protein
MQSIPKMVLSTPGLARAGVWVMLVLVLPPCFYCIRCVKDFAEAAGKVKWNVAPNSPLPLAQIPPPCGSTMTLDTHGIPKTYSQPRGPNSSGCVSFKNLPA